LANPTIKIKKLPDPAYRGLHQRSLNAYVIHMLQSDLDEHARFEKMREASAELERFVASLPSIPDSASLIRKDRERDT
jgi:hypothetical protein